MKPPKRVGTTMSRALGCAPQREPGGGLPGGSRERFALSGCPVPPGGGVTTAPRGVPGSPGLRRPDDDHPGRADDMPLTIDDLPDASRPVTTWPPTPVR